MHFVYLCFSSRLKIYIFEILTTLLLQLQTQNYFVYLFCPGLPAYEAVIDWVIERVMREDKTHKLYWKLVTLVSWCQINSDVHRSPVMYKAEGKTHNFFGENKVTIMKLFLQCFTKKLYVYFFFKLSFHKRVGAIIFELIQGTISPLV